MSREHQTPDSTAVSSNTTMLVVRLSPALKRAVEQASTDAGAASVSDWVRDLLVIHTKEQEQS